ncbi:MAG TPA: hypothetical protein VE360_06405 [Pyrinomonadaceae bacterium]|nr:hypothetical protein [Pyrinomonadaceae bacterium]
MCRWASASAEFFADRLDTPAREASRSRREASISAASDESSAWRAGACGAASRSKKGSRRAAVK